MGECGCGELQPIAKLRAPNGDWYALEVYPGCTYCGTSWGLGVTLVPKTDRDLLELLDTVPEVQFDPRVRQWGHPILDTAVLEREYRKEVGDGAPDAERELRAFLERTEDPAIRRKMLAHLDELAAAADPEFTLDEFVSSGGLRDVFYATLAGETPGAAQRDRDGEEDDEFEDDDEDDA